jgi:hypothetical protein
VADRDLKLNSLSRYSKESPLLILEEHGHCEVPAALERNTTGAVHNPLSIVDVRAVRR